MCKLQWWEPLLYHCRCQDPAEDIQCSWWQCPRPHVLHSGGRQSLDDKDYPTPLSWSRGWRPGCWEGQEASTGCCHCTSRTQLYLKQSEVAFINPDECVKMSNGICMKASKYVFCKLSGKMKLMLVLTGTWLSLSKRSISADPASLVTNSSRRREER